MDFNTLCTITNGKKNKYSTLWFTYLVVLPSGLLWSSAYTRSNVQNTDELLQRLLTIWNNKLEQQTTNNAVDQWRDRLAACVPEEGGHFEHTL